MGEKSVFRFCIPQDFEAFIFRPGISFFDICVLSSVGGILLLETLRSRWPISDRECARSSGMGQVFLRTPHVGWIFFYC